MFWMGLKRIVIMNSSWPLSLEHFDRIHESVEKEVSHREGSYQGLRSEALYTSLDDLNNIFNHSTIQGTLVDLGCGNARACLLYASKFPDRKALGIEFENSRLVPARQYITDHSLTNITLIHGDLLLDSIPEGDTYFLYFPTGKVLDRILYELYQNRRSFRLVAIESHGDLIPRLEIENWLTLKDKIPLVSARHNPDAYIFERNSESRSETLRPFEMSFVEKYLLLKNQDETWIGETLGMGWSGGERFELMTPPRTIYWGDVLKVCDFSEFDKKYRMAIEIRRMGEVMINTANAVYRGFIRKIIMEPTFHLELSGGPKVEWNEILNIQQGLKICYDSSLDY
jgi:hypothetical protein